MKKLLFILSISILQFSCKNNSDVKKNETTTDNYVSFIDAKQELSKYKTVKLTTDISKLSENDNKLVKTFIKAAEIMDSLFWYEAYGDQNEILSKITDENLKQLVKINYGPWDRLNGNASFVKGIGEKSPGANYYPKDITKAEFENATITDKDGQYNFIRRDDNGKLYSIPYHIQFKDQIARVCNLLKEAQNYTDDKGLKNYLSERIKALETDDYQKSDMAWLDMKTNRFDLVIGPIENYEDQLFGYKTAHEAYVLVKDMDWSKKLAKYQKFMPMLQQGLPVDAKYKAEKPGSDSELNAYDIIYYAGDCNAGSKTIAINLPNDEEVQLKKGTRRLQLKNAMKAKFDNIMMPISDNLIDDSQKKYVNFDAFFATTMFHEVAHGLGIKNTITGQGTVRKALKEQYSAMEEGKADMLGLYMIQQLYKKGEIKGDLKEYYTTFMAGIFRSIRFGTSSAHAKANLVRFNFFDEYGAFTRDPKSGKYTINFDKFEKAMNDLSTAILKLEGDGDYTKALNFITKYTGMSEDLKKDLELLKKKNIPVDVIFEQGTDVLGI